MFIIWSLTLLGLFFSYNKDKERTFLALNYSAKSLKRMLPSLFIMIATIGLILTAIPDNYLITIFSMKGIEGLLFASLIGAIVTIPGPIAFPLAGTFLKMGAHPAILASFITTLTMVGLMTAPIEATYFGKRFTFIRQLFSFVAAIIIGVLMGVLL